MYNRARQADGEDRLRRPRHSGRASLSYLRGQLRLGATARLIGSVEDEAFGSGRESLDGYVVLDLHGNLKLGDQLELFARVTNAFDENYRDIIGFRAQGTGAYAGARVRF